MPKYPSNVQRIRIMQKLTEALLMTQEWQSLDSDDIDREINRLIDRVRFGKPKGESNV